MKNTLFADNVVGQFKQFLNDKNIHESVLSDEEWAKLTEMVSNAAPKFKGEKDIDRANIVIGMFEDLLVANNVNIPNVERDEGDEDAALIYGEDYYNLEDEVLAFAKKFAVT